MEQKRLIYRTLWIAVGLMLATIVIGAIELSLIYAGAALDWVVLGYFGAILLLGLFLGLILGRLAWEKVYVKGARGLKYTLDHDVRIKDFEQKFFTDLKDFDIDKAMKWTFTIFLIFLMLVISVVVALKVILLAKLFF
jgi:hypothetical protein